MQFVHLPASIKPWGFHLIVDAYNCSYPLITNKVHVEKFAKTLVKEIDMVAYGEPQVVHFGEGDKAGFTLVQLIETSNITAHFCNDTGDVYFDIFSCKTFHPESAEKVINLFFEPIHLTSLYLERKATNSHDRSRIELYRSVGRPKETL
jgi:S-adenosylmethionine/arginine decarboxylase-like enzyme